MNDVKMRLAEIYEVLGEPRKALELVYQGAHILSVMILCRNLTRHQ